MPPLPPTPPPRTAPTLRLRVDDLAHPGVAVFFAAVVPAVVLQRAVDASMTWLYTRETAPTNVEEILLILLPMDGVANTSGTGTHKEIRLSLDYVLKTRDRAADEITGVLVHEVVHCFQHDARGTCPGGLIEGIADFVRLREGLAPPHWTQRAGGGWDAGYETTAYFLRWLDDTWGAGTVRALNARLDDAKYDARIFEDVTGVSVDELWATYVEGLEEAEREGAEEQEPVRAAPLAEWPMPVLAVRIDDLEHAGADVFLDAVRPKDVLRAAVLASFTRLYTLSDVPTSVKSITLILRAMDGIAHTTGTRTHKEIHLSLDYVLQARARAADEIAGVLVHEAVHCVQHTARGTCPGGLVEGIADFVRLRAGCAPPHWMCSADGAWDAGYERTAYFLAWLEERDAATGAAGTEGGTFVRRLNASMQHGAYDARIFETLAGQPVGALWSAYGASLAASNKAVHEGAPAEALPPA